MWLEPHILRIASPCLSPFRAVTTLSLHSLSIYRFDEDGLNTVFGQFFSTVKKLDLDDPRSSPQGLIRFVCHFSAVESLSISSPWWAEQDESISPAGSIPPFTGKLYLSKFQQDSTPFVRLLSKLPMHFVHITVIDCDWHPLPFSHLLRRVSHSLKYLAVSAWLNGVFYITRIHPYLTSHHSKNAGFHLLTSLPATNSRKFGSSLECSLQKTCHSRR